MAAAQDYPTKPIRLIIPFPPGGSNDIVGRLIAPQLSEQLGKQVVVDNRAGAGGIVGTELAAKAPPDGYTLLIISLAHAINPGSTSSRTTRSRRSRRSPSSPGAERARGQPSLPVNSVKELIALAKEKPGELQYASAGVGSFHAPRRRAVQLDGRRRSPARAVQGRRAGDDRRDRRPHQGRVRSLVQTMPHIRSGKLRALGVGAASRNPVLPDVPTIAEAGVPGYEADNWWGIVAPAGTPAPIVEKLHKAIGEVQLREVQKQFANEGAEIVQMSTAEFGAS